MKVKELNQNERPREKALRNGVEELSNRDLLAVILGSGTKGVSSLELADQILTQVGTIAALQALTITDLTAFKGIKCAKAISLLAAVELSRRMSEDEMRQSAVKIEHPKHLVEWLKAKIAYASQEHFVVIYLDHGNCILKHQILFRGSDHASIISAKEIYRLAVVYGASKIIVAHNHPAGSLTPSVQDIQTTQAIVQMGEMMGIHLLDHLIVTKEGYCSLRALNLLKG